MLTHDKKPGQSETVASTQAAEVRRQTQIARTLQQRWTPVFRNSNVERQGFPSQAYSQNRGPYESNAPTLSRPTRTGMSANLGWGNLPARGGFGGWGMAAGSTLGRPLLDTPGDAHEREADRVAQSAVRAWPRDHAVRADRQKAAAPSGLETPGTVPSPVRKHVESILGTDLRHVNVCQDATADAVTRKANARALTFGHRILLRSSEQATDVALMAHELTHTVQQDRASSGCPLIQRQAVPGAPAGPAQDIAFTGPLTAREWQLVELWLSLGQVGVEPLTDNADHNADVVAAAIFCSRSMSTLLARNTEDPLLCLDTSVTAADPRVRTLRQHVLAHGPLVNWTAVPTGTRLAFLVRALVDTYHFPVNGAAGIVGNLKRQPCAGGNS
jgi:hypothetical protein